LQKGDFSRSSIKIGFDAGKIISEALAGIISVLYRKILIETRGVYVTCHLPSQKYLRYLTDHYCQGFPKFKTHVLENLLAVTEAL
jgi:hypothetical protein